MRALFLLVVAGACLSTGCEDAVSGGGGSGGASGGGGSDAGGMGGQGGEGGAASECTVISIGKLDAWGQTYFEAPISPNILSPNRDVLSFSFWPNAETTTWSGVQDLGSEENSNFATCTTCINVYADEQVAEDDPPTKVFFQAGGTLDLGSAFLDDDEFGLGYIPDGVIMNARFIEVDVDVSTRISTPVPGGACFEIVMQAVAMPVPPEGWTCNPAEWDDDEDCNCGCGVLDEDCSDPDAPIGNCQEGQTCDLDTALCAGVPTTWTCDDSEFGGGVGNGCDCDCGGHDPDCDLDPPEAFDNCAAGFVCSPDSDSCYPPEWTCYAGWYGTGGSCECGCNVRDPDCVDETSVSCENCDVTGSCDDVACDDPTSTIDPLDNAHCL